MIRINPELLARTARQFELFKAGNSCVTVTGNQSAHQIRLRGEMMMNTRLTDADSVRDVGIAKAVIASSHDEAVSPRKNFLCFAR